jgi:hypothetical protein
MALVFDDTFPPAAQGFLEKEDAAYYKVGLGDSTMRSDTDGGYEFARKRFTKAPRSTFSTGFTEMVEADFIILKDFWTQYQGSKAFTWYNKAESANYLVRFSSSPKITYSGVGSRPLYNIEVELKEV